jgi:Pyruvate/2-oxoacid:ferredoxin oxidoreductase delta subunit
MKANKNNKNKNINKDIIDYKYCNGCTEVCDNYQKYLMMIINNIKPKIICKNQ